MRRLRVCIGRAPLSLLVVVPLRVEDCEGVPPTVAVANSTFDVMLVVVGEKAGVAAGAARVTHAQAGVLRVICHRPVGDGWMDG